MNEPIVTVDYVHRRAQEALKKNQPIKANPFPWHSAAHKTWHEEYQRLELRDTVRVAA